MVPWGFCFRAQKYSVFCGPMMSVRPRTKRIYVHGKGESGEHAHTVAKAHTFPSTRSAPSKKNMTPRSMNSTLNKVSEMMAHLALGQTCALRGRMQVVGTWTSHGGGQGAHGHVSWLTLKTLLDIDDMGACHYELMTPQITKRSTKTAIKAAHQKLCEEEIDNQHD